MLTLFHFVEEVTRSPFGVQIWTLGSGSRYCTQSVSLVSRRFATGVQVEE